MALAEALSPAGIAVHFFMPPDSLSAARDRVRDAGWSEITGQPRTADIVTAAGTGAVVVLDTYRVDGAWIEALHAGVRAAGSQLTVIDDDGARNFSADLVVNQNAGAETHCYPRVARHLRGPRYALLRPGFAHNRERGLASLARLTGPPQRVFVLFGGTDATGMAVPAARAARQAFPAAHVRAVVPGGGEAFPGVEVLPYVDNVVDEMLRADLVLSAGGSTLWEICCLARPAAVVAVAANQHAAYDEMVRRGAIMALGRVPVRDVDVLAHRLREAATGPGTLRAVAERAAAVTDGQGADRVATVLTQGASHGFKEPT